MIQEQVLMLQFDALGLEHSNVEFDLPLMAHDPIAQDDYVIADHLHGRFERIVFYFVNPDGNGIAQTLATTTDIIQRRLGDAIRYECANVVANAGELNSENIRLDAENVFYDLELIGCPIGRCYVSLGKLKTVLNSVFLRGFGSFIIPPSYRVSSSVRSYARHLDANPNANFYNVNCQQETFGRVHSIEFPYAKEQERPGEKPPSKRKKSNPKKISGSYTAASSLGNPISGGWVKKSKQKKYQTRCRTANKRRECAASRSIKTKRASRFWMPQKSNVAKTRYGYRRYF